MREAYRIELFYCILCRDIFDKSRQFANTIDNDTFLVSIITSVFYDDCIVYLLVK